MGWYERNNLLLFIKLAWKPFYTVCQNIMNLIHLLVKNNLKLSLHYFCLKNPYLNYIIVFIKLIVLLFTLNKTKYLELRLVQNSFSLGIYILFNGSGEKKQGWISLLKTGPMAANGLTNRRPVK